LGQAVAGWAEPPRVRCALGSIPAPKLQARLAVNVRPRLGADAPPPGRGFREPQQPHTAPHCPASGHPATGIEGDLLAGYKTAPCDRRGDSKLLDRAPLFERRLVDPSHPSRLLGQRRPSSGSRPRARRRLRSSSAPSNARRLSGACAVPALRGQTAVRSAPGSHRGPRRPPWAAGLARDPPFSSWCMLVG